MCSSDLVEVPLPDYVSGENVEVYSTYEGVDNALYTGEGSSVTWEVEIPESGLYNVCLEYMTVESRGVAIERALYINGELPFDDAANMAFSRLWMDGGEVRVDNQGNEIRPTQVEAYAWQRAYCRDDMGYISEPYEFYLEKGRNELTLEAVNEPMVIGKLSITAVKELPSYEEYLESQTGSAASGEGLAYVQTVQGEDASLRSEIGRAHV